MAVVAESVDPANEGKLIHVSGEATAPGTLTNPVLHIAAPALLFIAPEHLSAALAASGKNGTAFRI